MWLFIMGLCLLLAANLLVIQHWMRRHRHREGKNRRFRFNGHIRVK